MSALDLKRSFNRAGSGIWLQLDGIFAMKWREPWLESLKSQPPFRPFGRRVARAIINWSLAIAVLIAIGALGRDGALREVVSRWWVVPIGAGSMSFLLYCVWWLSPRKIDSGPRGIVVTKADELLLIPWDAILSFKITPTALRIAIGGDSEHVLMLPGKAPIAQIEGEILKMTRAQTIRSGRPE